MKQKRARFWSAGFGDRVLEAMDRARMNRTKRAMYYGYVKLDDCKGLTIGKLLELSDALRCDVCWLIWGNEENDEDNSEQ